MSGDVTSKDTACAYIPQCLPPRHRACAIEAFFYKPHHADGLPAVLADVRRPNCLSAAAPEPALRLDGQRTGGASRRRALRMVRWVARPRQYAGDVCRTIRH